MNIYGNYIEESYNSHKNTSYINEGIIAALKKMFKSNKITKTEVYDCSQDKKPNDRCPSQKSPSEAIKFWICSVYNCTCDNGKVIFVRQSNYNAMVKENLYLYVSKYIKEYNPKAEGYDNQNKWVFVETIAEGNIMDLIKKYSIDYEIRDNSALRRQRTKYFNDACAIAKKILAEVSKEDPRVKKGFVVSNYNSDDKWLYEEFINGFDNRIGIIDCDAWAYTNNKARDDAEYDNYIRSFDKIYAECKKLITFADIDYGGDWDDGPIEIIVKD